MKYVKIMIAVVWLISLADVLGLGVGSVRRRKKTYVPKSRAYYKAVGAFNVVIGVVGIILLQIFVIGSWTGPGWMVAFALVGSFVNIIFGLISVVVGVMMPPLE